MFTAQTVKALAQTTANAALTTAAYATVLVVAITVESNVRNLIKK